MKVVLFKSPKFLSGILRLVFGIKKESKQPLSVPSTITKNITILLNMIDIKIS